MIPPLMPCGSCYYCVHYPRHANKCLTPVLRRPLSRLRQAAASLGRVGRDGVCRSRHAAGHEALPAAGRHAALAGHADRTLHLHGARVQAAQEIGNFRAGDTVVIQGSGTDRRAGGRRGREMGAGRVIVVGAPEEPRLALCRKFGAEATVDISPLRPGAERIGVYPRDRRRLRGRPRDGLQRHPSAGPEGIEMLRDGGAYVEIGQFTDAGAVETNWTGSARRTSPSWAAGLHGRRHLDRDRHAEPGAGQIPVP